MSLGKLLGFEVRLDLSWFIIFFLVSSSLADEKGSLLLGVVGALLVFGSVLLHEIGHSVVGRRLGLQIEGITLFIFGGVARLKEEPQRPGVEFLMTIAGPAVSAALSAAFLLAADGAAQMGAPAGVSRLLNTVGWVNASIAVFNLIPAFPLDGGRLFRSTVWALTGSVVKATRWASVLSKVFAFLLGAAGLVQVVRGDWGGLWLVVLAMFIRVAGRDAYRQVVLRAELEAVPIETLVGSAPVYIPASSPLNLAAEYLQASGQAGAFVTEGDEVRGVITAGDIRAVPERQHPWVTALEVCQPLGSAKRIELDENAWQALASMVAANVRRLVVVREGRLRGVLTVEQLAGRLSHGIR